MVKLGSSEVTREGSLLGPLKMSGFAQRSKNKGGCDSYKIKALWGSCHGMQGYRGWRHSLRCSTFCGCWLVGLRSFVVTLI